jgi:serine/threonine protein kinase
VTVETSRDHTHVRLARRYQLTESLARGSLCVVYRGDDLVLKRPIAVKVVPASLVATYRSSLRQTAALTHPAVIACYDAIEHNGWLYLIQEYVPARPLTAYIAAGVPVQRAVALAEQITRAVGYAHAQGIAHGDLTPNSILVDRHATIRINNFALPPDQEYIASIRRQIALAPERLVSERGGASTPTARDDIVSPRAQRDAVPPGDADSGAAQADVWAIGALLWQMLTTPASGGSFDQPDYRDDVPEVVITLIGRCVDAGHPRRFSSAAELALALEHLADDVRKLHPSSAPLTPPALRAAREAAADIAHWQQEEPAAGMPADWWAAAPEDAGQFNAPTDPLLGDLAATQPTAQRDKSPMPPRLSLPSRPLGEPVESYPMTPSAPRWEVPRQGTTLAAGESTSRAGVSVVLVLALGALLFIIFFVIGFLMPSLFAH